MRSQRTGATATADTAKELPDPRFFGRCTNENVVGSMRLQVGVCEVL